MGFAGIWVRFKWVLSRVTIVVGYCHRKDKCWFKHVQPVPTSIAQTAGTAGVESLDDAESVDGDEACCICHEKPKVYGLLGKLVVVTTFIGVVAEL